MPAYLLQGLILGATAAAQPGPFRAFLLSLTTRNGWRGTLSAAFAPLLSDGPILLLVLLVLTQLPAWLLSALQIAGGLFLLYLAWRAWQLLRRDESGEEATDSAEPGAAKANITRAALMNFLSPSSYVFWATVAGPILIEAWRQSPALGLAFLVGFYVALIGGLMLFVLFCGGAGKIDPRVNRALGAVSAVALFGFGLYRLAAGISGLGAALA